MKRSTFIILLISWIILYPILWAHTLYYYMPSLGDTICMRDNYIQYHKGDWMCSFPHGILLFVTLLLYLCGIIIGIVFLANKNTDQIISQKIFVEEDIVTNPGKYVKKIFIWIICLIILYWLSVISKSFYYQSKLIYNNHQIYEFKYQQKTKERLGFYDKLWKTYLTKEKITNINKDVFIQVTKIIMENRKDGQNVTWKWLQENQQIPYSEFVSFYSDLSSFIESQREDYYKLEKDCQLISIQNNIMLDTFPNNIYNKLLKCDKINFEYGFLSDSTNQVFSNKIENLK